MKKIVSYRWKLIKKEKGEVTILTSPLFINHKLFLIEFQRSFQILQSRFFR